MLAWLRLGSVPPSPAGSGGFGVIPTWAGICLQTPSDGARGQIPPRRGASAHRALGCRSRKYSVSTLGVQHFRGAQEPRQTAGAPRLCLFISLAPASRGSAGGSAAEPRRVNTGAERRREREGQGKQKHSCQKNKSLKRAIQGLPGAGLAQGRTGSTCCWCRHGASLLGDLDPVFHPDPATCGMGVPALREEIKNKYWRFPNAGDCCPFLPCHPAPRGTELGAMAHSSVGERGALGHAADAALLIQGDTQGAWQSWGGWRRCPAGTRTVPCPLPVTVT